MPVQSKHISTCAERPLSSVRRGWAAAASGAEPDPNHKRGGGGSYRFLYNVLDGRRNARRSDATWGYF